MKRIPISAAKRFAEEFGQSTIVVVAWEGDSCPTPSGRTHVITYGRAVQDCEWAADLGNRIKRDILGWPEKHCHAKPARAKKRMVQCGTFGCTRAKPENVVFCEMCQQDFNEDPEAYK